MSNSVANAIRAVQTGLPPVLPVLLTDDYAEKIAQGYCYCLCHHCGLANWVHEAYMAATHIAETHWACDDCAETRHSLSAIPHYAAACEFAETAEVIHGE